MSDGIDPAMAELGLGAKVADYRLDEQIGRGGMAVVYRAQDERLDRRVALKILAPELARDAAFRMRFIRESRAAAAVDHPNIIPIYDAGNAVGVLYIAMRYVQGGDVRSLLERLGPLPAAQAWSIIAQVASALDTAHVHGLIHRDVKPANILLDASGAPPGATPQPVPGDHFEHVYLSDFGISKQSLSKGFTSTGQFVGTLDYVAPEQIEGRGVDGRTDLYSLACAAFELLCGTPPFQRDQGLALLYAQLSEPPPSLVARRADLPAAVDRVLARALAKKPAERYSTCMEFARELSTALGVAQGEHGGPETGAPRQPGPWPATELAGPLSQPDPEATGNIMPGGQGEAPVPLPLAPGFPAAAPGAQGPTGQPARLYDPTSATGAAEQAPEPRPGDQAGQAQQPWPGGPGGRGQRNPQQPWPGGQAQQDPQQPWPGGQAQQSWPGGQAQQQPQQPWPADQAQQRWPGDPGGQAQQPWPGGQVQQPWQAQQPWPGGPGGQAQQPWPGGPGGQAQQPWPGGQGGQGWQGTQAGPGGQGWQGQGASPTWPAGPGGPGWPQQASQRPPRRRSGAVLAGVAIAAVVVIAVAAAAIFGLRKSSPHVTQGTSPPVTSSTSSSASALASSEATQVNSLLNASDSTHQVLVTGLNDVENCSDPSGGVTLLQKVVRQRRSEVSHASALQAGALQNGAALQSNLQQALSYSLRSDQANLTWARQDVSNGCAPRGAPVNASDTQAAKYKTLFLRMWNPMAPQYGFQVRSFF